MDRWSTEKAKAWWADQSWVCGFNFLPSSAVNFLEMWHPATFDRTTIARELGWSCDLGFNALRVNLNYLVWKHDRDGLLDRLEWLLQTASELGLKTVPCFFDDCGFGGFESEYGSQPDPVAGVHNSRAVASPGRARLLDGSEWAGFEKFVRDITRTHRQDPRILFWDLYNEPGNRMIFEVSGASTYSPDFSSMSHQLMRDSFVWCRDEAPVQPVTVGAWVTPLPGSEDDPYLGEIDQDALTMSDIITFHAYWDDKHVDRFITHLERLERPMLCTEWMARPIGSRIDSQLGLFRTRNVGCFQWGLVKGRTQTYLPWPAQLVAAHGGDADRTIWFHDILDEEGRPYDIGEVTKLKQVTGARN